MRQFVIQWSKVFCALVLICSLCTIFGVSVPSAAAAGSPYCALGGSGRCGSDEGKAKNGSAIRVEKRHLSASQNVVVEKTKACGHGFVTAKCPFATSQNNGDYLHQPIDIIKITAINKCWAGPAEFVVVEPCNAAGTEWVGVQTRKNEYIWVNPYYINHSTHNVPYWLWTDNKEHHQLGASSSTSTVWAH